MKNIQRSNKKIVNTHIQINTSRLSAYLFMSSPDLIEITQMVVFYAGIRQLNSHAKLSTLAVGKLLAGALLLVQRPGDGLCLKAEKQRFSRKDCRAGLIQRISRPTKRSYEEHIFTCDLANIIVYALISISL